MKKIIFTVMIVCMTAAVMYAADCTCAVGCSSITAITLPFTKDGIADACYQTPCLGSSINSWNLTTLNINGTDFTNKWADASTYPAAINGQYYIYYKSTVSYGHFEAVGTCSGVTTAPGGDTISPTNPPADTLAPTTPGTDTIAPTALPVTPAPTTPPGETSAPTETPGPTAIPTATPVQAVTDTPTTVPTPDPTDVSTPVTTDAATPGTTSAPGALDCTNYPIWTATSAYETAGTIVFYNGNLYKNNWYSINENPEENSGTSQVWTLVGACDPNLTPSPIPSPYPTVTWVGTAGYATRFWDCCKPHCAWTANVPAGMAPLQTCQIDGITENPDPAAVSSCEGGTSYVCYRFIPFIVAEDLSYGFAATSSGDICGKCFEVQFTGTGKYSNTPGVVALQGKRMIVMAINIGFDVGGGQFDIMIPGGGVGAFNGCSTQWGIPNDLLGAQYGGLLTACNQEVGYYDHEAIKNCLRTKNDELFRARGLTEMAAGLDWFIDWYEAADNPNLIYREVTCPQELIDISGLVRP